MRPQRPIDGLSLLHFSNSTLWGGVEEHICGLLRNIAKDQFRPQLVCDPAIYDRYRAAVPSDIVVTPLALSSPKHIAGAVQFASLLVNGKVQIVHSHMFWSSLFASPIAWACRVPVIVETLHGTEAWRTGWKANNMLDRATSSFVSKYVAVSASDARFLATKKRVPVGKIAIIHNGIDVAPFNAVNMERNKLREALGFTDNDLVLIMVARMHRGKGHRILFDAMRRLIGPYPTLKLICLGEGEEQSQLRELSERYALSHCIRFLGYQKNVAEWLRAVDINVLPTFYEGLPLTVLEAMAAGLPTVASNVGGIPDAIQHGVSGVLVPPGDAVILADSISALLREPATRSRLGHAAQDRVRQNFCLEQQVSGTEKMYRDLFIRTTAHRHGNTVPHSSPEPQPSRSAQLTDPEAEIVA